MNEPTAHILCPHCKAETEVLFAWRGTQFVCETHGEVYGMVGSQFYQIELAK